MCEQGYADSHLRAAVRSGNATPADRLDIDDYQDRLDAAQQQRDDDAISNRGVE